MATSKNTSSTEQSRIEGAKAIIEALRRIERSIEEGAANAPELSERDAAALHYEQINSDCNRLADTAGDMPPFQRGAFLALAEYVHFTLTTGTPDLGQWMPKAAKTADQYAADFECLVADMERGNAVGEAVE